MPSSDAVSIDTVKAYWDARPCNIRHSTQPVGTRQYFDEVEERKYRVEPHIPGFAQFERWRGRKVLEVGCGIGTDTINFARAGAEVTAVELSSESLAVATRRAEVFGLQERIRFVRADAERLEEALEPEPFDLVYSFGVIHHTPRPERAVAQIRRFMAPGAEFRMMVYARSSWKRIMIDAGLDQPEAQAGCPVAYTYSHEEVRGLLAGFQVIDIRQDHIFPFVVEKYVRYEYEVVPWFAAMPQAMFRALETHLGWHTLVVARLR
jgi:ubiquinone/menaquinone biosynthesis C-methylase UbiE